MIVRHATHSDIYAIARIHQSAIRSTTAFYTLAQIDSWAAHIVPEAYLPYIAASDFFVVVDGQNGVIGFASLDRHHAEVASVYVDPAHVLRGAGRRLIEEIEASARAADIIRLHVTASLYAMPFYRAVGFDLVEHATSHTRGGIEMPCARMVKNLVPIPVSSL